MVGYNLTSYFTEYRMRVLFLLASLCLPSLILSDFKEMVVNCTSQSEVENCNHTNSCEWNISLAMCSTLEIQCVETEGKSSQKKLCSSLEECGLKKNLKFINTLLGWIDCKTTDGEIKCSLAVACNQSIYLCEKTECDHTHRLSGSKNNKRYCKFHHSIAKCIKENGKFPGPINCTMKSATASNNDLGPNTERQSGNTTGFSKNYNYGETLILRIVVEHLAICIAVFLCVLCWIYKFKICRHRQCIETKRLHFYRQGTAENTFTENIELQPMGNTEHKGRQAGAAGGKLDKHSQHQLGADENVEENDDEENDDDENGCEDGAQQSGQVVQYEKVSTV